MKDDYGTVDPFHPPPPSDKKKKKKKEEKEEKKMKEDKLPPLPQQSMPVIQIIFTGGNL